jgi:hypothetical protein
VSKQKPTPKFSPREWVPIDDAYTQVLACVGSPELAERDLYQDLLDGRLKTVFRHISRDGNETRRELKPSDWRQWTIGSGSESHRVYVHAVDEDYKIVDGYFFVRRADLDKHYPTATPTTTSVHRLDETRPRERRRGPVPTYEWHVIDGEIALRCINPKTRLLEIPKSERRLAQDMLAWCHETYGKEPAESEMREAVKAICAALRKAYK